MGKLFFLILLVFSAQLSLAAGSSQIEIKMILNLSRCDDVLVDGKFQNCVENAPYEKQLTFDLTKNCKQTADVVTCSGSAMHTARMDNGSTTALIVVSRKDKAGSSQVSATVILTPGVSVSQQSVLNLTLSESGLFPPEIRLQATSFKAQDDSRIYFPSLVIK